MTDRTKEPEPSEPPVDYEAEFAKLDARATQKAEGQPAVPEGIQEVRVQFRGAVFAENPAVELRVGDTVVAYIQGKDMDLLAASAPRLGTDGNTVVMWGYLPPPEV